ncbi:MAG: hypothetical protein H6729_13520 [Deltaproteobacteria bacterium]|nr:hypothetical protein [Deltaproteobacteria bacterium]
MKTQKNEQAMGGRANGVPGRTRADENGRRDWIVAGGVASGEDAIDLAGLGDAVDRETFLWRWALAEALGPPVSARRRRRRL